jgi:formylglycine-generating enzyme required for sulfatase activity
MVSKQLVYKWNALGKDHVFELVHVGESRLNVYSFGYPSEGPQIDLRAFFIGTVPVTRALWMHVMGADPNPSVNEGPDLPLVNASWNDLTCSGGFLDRINDGPIPAAFSDELGYGAEFRLPSETEWEYAARGGPHWKDGFRFSGSDDIDRVAWYDRKHGDHTQAVQLKAPNQLGIYDLSGNVWEWCQDVFTPNVNEIPKDGSAFVGTGDERVLRGGCFHNWAVHCTVSKRYEISRAFHDGCVGFRLVFG